MSNLMFVFLICVVAIVLFLSGDKDKNRYTHRKYDPSKEYKLYYVRLKTDAGMFYKLGYTTMGSVQDRFAYSGDDDLIDEVLMFEYRQDAMQIEKDLHRKYRRKAAFKWGESDPNMPLYGNGQSELYRSDVMGLDR